MSTCLILTSPADARLVPLAEAFAAGGPLGLWYVEQRRGADKLADVPLDAAAEDPELESLRQRLASSQHTLTHLRSEDAKAAVLDELPRRGVELLVLPQHARSHNPETDSFLTDLFRQAPCDMLLVSAFDDQPITCEQIVVSTRGGRDAGMALTRASSAAEQTGGTATALYVQLEVDEVAKEVGQRRLDAIVRRARVHNSEHVRQRVELANSFAEGLAQALAPPTDDAAAGRCDLLLFGTPAGRSTSRVIDARTLADAAPGARAVAVARSAEPYTSRLVQRARRALQRGVPQLDREKRVELVDRLQQSSQWNFDFAALMCLSTLIATLGLMQDSAAVVIGAMLVAPLMTPLVAIGLAVVQGNRLLLRMALKTVLIGFLLAVLVAFGCAKLAAVLGGPLANWPNSEMLARGSPGILDLLVAFTSGLAAAYAMGRKNLVSALPGVAIAAALVPPVATSAIAAALGEYRLAGGALLLFFTNIVAIVLASCVSLALVGVRDTHAHGTRVRWSPLVLAALCALAVGLAVVESRPPLPTAVIDEVRAAVERTPNYTLAEVRLSHTGGERALLVAVECSAEEHDEDLVVLLARLRSIATSRLGEETGVRLESQRVKWSP